MKTLRIEVEVDYDGEISDFTLRDYLSDALMEYEMGHPNARIVRMECEVA